MKNVRSLPGDFFWLTLYIAGEDYTVLRPEADSFLWTFIQKRKPNVNDLNETTESKICTFVLLSWPIVLSELDVMIVRFGSNDTNWYTCQQMSSASVKSSNKTSVYFSVDFTYRPTLVSLILYSTAYLYTLITMSLHSMFCWVSVVRVCICVMWLLCAFGQWGNGRPVRPCLDPPVHSDNYALIRSSSVSKWVSEWRV